MERLIEPLLILCGGASRRMGRNKALLLWQGEPLLQHQIRRAQRPVWLAAGNTRYPNSEQTLYLPDAFPEPQGPLSGLLPALEHAAACKIPALFVISCDNLLDPEEVITLLERSRDCHAAAQAREQGIVFLKEDEHIHPLLARYCSTLAPSLKNYLLTGQRRIRPWLLAQACYGLPLPQAWRTRCNLNTPEEYQRALTEMQNA